MAQSEIVVSLELQKRPAYKFWMPIWVLAEIALGRRMPKRARGWFLDRTFKIIAT